MTKGNGHIQMVQTEKLHCAEWNPRIITQRGLVNLQKSLQADPDLMLRRPILALPDGTIYAGNMRYVAAVNLGWNEVPVIYDDIPLAKAKERGLRDNNVYGEWQDEALGEILAEMRDSEVDIEALGFSPVLIEEVLGNNEYEPAELTPIFAIYIECADEIEQTTLLARFQKENVKCRALIS